MDVLLLKEELELVDEVVSTLSIPTVLSQPVKRKRTVAINHTVRILSITFRALLKTLANLSDREKFTIKAIL